MPTMARYGEQSLPTLVLLHGFLGTKADWLPLMPALSQHFHCLCVDLPGHGDNQEDLLPQPTQRGEEHQGFPSCVEGIIALLDGLNIRQFHLYGYSLGGRIALHLAKAHPERLLSLHLESCHPGLEDPQEKLARMKHDALWAERLLKLNLNEFLALWYLQPVFAYLTKSARQQLIQQRAANVTEQAKRTIQHTYLATSLARQDSLWDLPGTLDCECHFYVGNQDAKFSALAQQWQERSSILVHSIMGAGHNIHQAAPQRLISRLIALLV